MSVSQNIVTIDGPAGVGKTTLAKKVAEALGLAYLDTGAMFRALASALGEQSLAWDDARIRQEAAGLMDFELRGCGEKTVLCLGGTAIGQEIRTEEVGALASRLAVRPVVRELLKEAQRALGASTALVVEGRDMGTVIFPQASHKFFLDASPRVRAQRRLGDLRAQGREVILEELEQQIRERDDRDRNRPVAPLRPAEDAFLIDTSEMTVEEVLQTILNRVRG